MKYRTFSPQLAGKLTYIWLPISECGHQLPWI